MKFAHLSDLHLGKRIHHFSMIEDQRYILEQILDILEREQVDGVFIAGDIYDKAVPSAESVTLFDDFLVKLTQQKRQVYVISGNHDSPERIAFASRLLNLAGVHLSPVYGGPILPIQTEDEYGKLDIYLLPFIKPVHVRYRYPDAEIINYTDAIDFVIKHMDLDLSRRNILLAHQLVTGASRSDSEDISVGGLDNVDAEVFEPFDYVALGHIHGPQNIGGEKVRYCGTPLKYSFSEAGHVKSVSIVELREKGDLSIRQVPLKPMRDMRKIRGTFAEVTKEAFYRNESTEDYVHITLLDEEEVNNAFAKLSEIYPNLMQMEYDNRRTRNQLLPGKREDAGRVHPMELFEEFYETMNQQPLSGVQKKYLIDKMEQIWEEI